MPRHTRLPVTPELLRGVLSVWSTAPPTFDRVMLWAAFSMGFFAFLRAGEFTCQSLESFDQSSMVALGDVWVDSHSDPWCLTIKLKQSKGNPFGHGVLIHLGHTFQPLCPVVAVLSYLAICPSTPGPFFVFSDGSPLSRERLISALSQALKDSGVDPSNFKGHSFRIGAATTATKVGLSDSLIRVLGRWHSSAFMSYIRTPKGHLAGCFSVFGWPLIFCWSVCFLVCLFGWLLGSLFVYFVVWFVCALFDLVLLHIYYYLFAFALCCC